MGIRKDTKTLLKGLKLDLLTIRYFSIAVEYCISNDIDASEVNLTKDIYPAINNEIKNTTEQAIESHMVKAMIKSRKECKKDIYYDRFNIKHPSIKKVLIKLIENLKYVY